jgi:hypothetical protein
VPLDTPEQVVTVLADTPRRIEAATAGLNVARLHHRLSPDEWSANDVLAHLRACADVWGDCIVRILQEDTPTIRAVDPRTWMDKTDYPRVRFPVALAAFSAQRQELLAVLGGLSEDAWSRNAVVTGAGKALERTVLSYARWLARHERPHVKQIERAIAAG